MPIAGDGDSLNVTELAALLCAKCSASSAIC
jgi:hypothetical protein